MCEDYRAGLTVDYEHGEADRREGRRIECPMLFLYATEDDMERDLRRPPGRLAPWVSDSLEGRAIHSGHHQAEEAPGELTAALREFLG